MFDFANLCTTLKLFKSAEDLKIDCRLLTVNNHLSTHQHSKIMALDQCFTAEHQQLCNKQVVKVV